MAQKERENFYRNSTVIVDLGKEALTFLLENELNTRNMTFEMFINQCQHEIYHLCYNRNPCCLCPNGLLPPNTPRNRVLFPSQLDILLDTGRKLPGHKTSNWSTHCCSLAKQNLPISSLDITLLRCLLVNFAVNCQIPSPERMAVEKIVECRNKLYGHTKAAKISDVDYAVYKADVKTALLTIARFCNKESKVNQALNDVDGRPLDETICLKYQNTLLEEIRHQNEIKEEFTALKRHITDSIRESLSNTEDNLKQDMNEMSTIIGKKMKSLKLKTDKKEEQLSGTDHSSTLIKEHFEDISYVETRAVTVGLEILQLLNILVIVGRGGSGKTKTGLQLISTYQKMNFIPLIFIDKEINQNRDLICLDEQCVILIEDFFGRTSVHYSENEHKNILDMLLSFTDQHNNLKIILTVRNNTGECLKTVFSEHALFQDETIVNLDQDWQLTEKEKREVLIKNMEKYNISLCTTCTQLVDFCEKEIVEKTDGRIQICQSVVQDIVYCNSYHGFPQASRMFCMDRSFTKLGVRYFTNPTNALVQQINHIMASGFDNQTAKCQYVILVYSALVGSIDISKLRQNVLKGIVRSIYNIDMNFPQSLLKVALTSLKGTYFKICSSSSTTGSTNELSFQHQTIREAVLLSYGGEHPQDLLDFCDLDFIREYIRPETCSVGNQAEQVPFLRVPLQLLVSRLVQIFDGNSSSVYDIGLYIREHSLVNRNDALFKLFFDTTRGQFTDGHDGDFYESYRYDSICSSKLSLFLDVLTRNGKCPKILEHHSEMCRDFFPMLGSIPLMKTFCRPESSLVDHSKFVMIQDSVLIKILTDRCVTRSWKTHRYICELLGEYLYLITKENNHEFVNQLFSYLMNEFSKPHQLTYIIDGWTKKGNRRDVLFQYTDLFSEQLIEYCSGTVLSSFFRPKSCNSDSNLFVIFEDDKLIQILCELQVDDCAEFLITIGFQENRHEFVNKTLDALNQCENNICLQILGQFLEKDRAEVMRFYRRFLEHQLDTTKAFHNICSFYRPFSSKMNQDLFVVIEDDILVKILRNFERLNVSKQWGYLKEIGIIEGNHEFVKSALLDFMNHTTDICHKAQLIKNICKDKSRKEIVMHYGNILKEYLLKYAEIDQVCCMCRPFSSANVDQLMYILIDDTVLVEYLRSNMLNGRPLVFSFLNRVCRKEKNLIFRKLCEEKEIMPDPDIL